MCVRRDLPESTDTDDGSLGHTPRQSHQAVVTHSALYALSNGISIISTLTDDVGLRT